MMKTNFTISLPTWVSDYVNDQALCIPTLEARMQFVIALSRLNVEHETGGPFGAAIFDMDSHCVISVGVNRVIQSHCSIAHAEMIAISIAQQQLQSYDLGIKGAPCLELIASTEPCAMCFGAIPWSGVRQLVCGARDSDARHIGFDEGPKHAHWSQELEQRDIQVITDVCRVDAVKVLNDYQKDYGTIYNARQGGDKFI